MSAGAVSHAGPTEEALRFNPSRWSRRALLAGLALAGAAIASYLALYQLGRLGSVWDPIFDGDSARVLHSPLERLLPVPDSALGAAAYLAELLADLIGGRERWRRQPWAVLLFGAIVAALALTAIALVALQLFVFHALCALCLTSAAISLLVAALASEEVLATINWLRVETGLGRPLTEAVVAGERREWRSGDGTSGEARDEPATGVRSQSPADAGNEAAAEPAGADPGGQADRRSTARPAATTKTIESTEVSAMADDTNGTPGGEGQLAAAHGSVDRDGSSRPIGSLGPNGAAVAQAARPGGPDVDGGNEQLWRSPDRSTDEQASPGGVVVVAGAAAGLGRAIVREFAKHGYDVGLIARDRASLENAKAEVESCGGRAVVCAIDVADAQAVDDAAQRIEDELGPIDVWVNDAMVSVFSPVKEMLAEEYKRVTEVTYLGYVYGTLAALRRMLPRDRGAIVHVGSALAHRSIPLQSAYCASKHAIMGFHESLRTELLHDKSKVHTTIVEMPALNTPQFDWVKSRLPDKPQPVPPIYDPEVGAEAVYYAALHPERREYIVGLSTWLAIQGNKIAPGLADWYLARTGYASQQTGEPDSPGRSNNLWQPVPGDHGAHGRFDGRAMPTSRQVWATTHRPIVAGAVAAIGLLALGGLQALSSLTRGGER